MELTFTGEYSKCRKSVSIKKNELSPSNEINITETAARTDLGGCRLLNCTFGKLLFG